MLHAGDITKLDGAKLPPVDIITGGSPCQDLSVAGKRKGLAGERSGLFMEQIRVIKEMRDADKKRGRTGVDVRPRFGAWENVPGAYSSGTPKGEDLRIVLEEFIRIADDRLSVPRPEAGRWEYAGAILGAECSLAFRTYDAQFWGVPQRRRRIYLVADFAGHSAPTILFEQDRLFGDTAQGEGTRQGPATPAQGGAGGAGGDCLTPWDVQSKRIHDEGGTWPALCSSESGGRGYVNSIAFSANQRDEVRDLHGVAGAIQAQPGMKQQTFVAQPLPPDDVFAFHINQREETIDLGDVSGALLTTRNMQMQTFVSQPIVTPINTQIATRHKKQGEGTGLGVGSEGDAAYTLQEAHAHAVFINHCLNPWDTQQTRISVPEGIAPTLAGADAGGGRNPEGLVLSAGFCAGAAPSAGGIGWQEECAPTLKASESGTNMVPSVLCLNDQGGQVMHVSEDISGTLRAQMHSHQPLVLATQQGGAEIGIGICPTITSAAGMSGNNQPVLFENHAQNSRCNGPLDVAPTITQMYGTGGNSQPLVAQDAEVLCIAGNIIDRQPQNGGNGFGYQSDICYSLTCADRHAIYQQTVGALCKGDEKGTGNQYVGQDKCIIQPKQAQVFGQSQFANYAEGVSTLRAQGGDHGGGSENLVTEPTNLIRRLTPLECERLQGFPDCWTDIPNASDSARYKALGNSVAIPCVEHVLRGVSYYLHRDGGDNNA